MDEMAESGSGAFARSPLEGDDEAVDEEARSIRTWVN